MFVDLVFFTEESDQKSVVDSLCKICSDELLEEHQKIRKNFKNGNLHTLKKEIQEFYQKNFEKQQIESHCTKKNKPDQIYEEGNYSSMVHGLKTMWQTYIKEIRKKENSKKCEVLQSSMPLVKKVVVPGGRSRRRTTGTSSGWQKGSI